MHHTHTEFSVLDFRREQLTNQGQTWIQLKKNIYLKTGLIQPQIYPSKRNKMFEILSFPLISDISFSSERKQIIRSFNSSHVRKHKEKSRSQQLKQKIDPEIKHLWHFIYRSIQQPSNIYCANA